MDRIANIKFKAKLYYYAAHVTDVYDGDTLTVDLDLGVGIWRRNQTIRLWKLNTPEVRGEERPRGLEVRDFVRGLILNKSVLLRTILDKRGGDSTGKFGRLLGEILFEDEEGKVINLNDLLLVKNMALPLRADGSAVIAGTGMAVEPAAPPVSLPCPLCGQTRQVLAGMVAQCPNCLDEPYPFMGLV